jgi:hypothetical protein
LLVIATKVEMVAEVDAGESMSREIDVARRLVAAQESPLLAHRAIGSVAAAYDDVHVQPVPAAHEAETGSVFPTA